MATITRQNLAELENTAASDQQVFYVEDTDAFYELEINSGAVVDGDLVINAPKMGADARFIKRTQTPGSGGGGFAPDPTGQTVGDSIRVNATQDDYEFYTPGSGGGAPIRTFIYQPGGTEDAATGVYTDLDNLIAAMDAEAPLPRKLFFDNSQAGLGGAAIALPAKTWNMGNVTLTASVENLDILGGDPVPQEVSFADGTTFTGGMPILERLDVRFQNSGASPYVIPTGETCTFTADIANIKNSGNAVVDATAANAAMVLVGQNLGLPSSGPLVNLGASASSVAAIFLSSYSSADLGDVAIGTAGTLNFTYDASTSLNSAFTFTGQIVGGIANTGLSDDAQKVYMTDVAGNPSTVDAQVAALRTDRTYTYTATLLAASSNSSAVNVIADNIVPSGRRPRINSIRIKNGANSWAAAGGGNFEVFSTTSGQVLISIDTTDITENAHIENGHRVGGTGGALATGYVTHATASATLDQGISIRTTNDAPTASDLVVEVVVSYIT